MLTTFLNAFIGGGNAIAQQYNTDANLPIGNFNYVVQQDRAIGTTTFRYVLIGSLAVVLLIVWYIKRKK